MTDEFEPVPVILIGGVAVIDVIDDVLVRVQLHGLPWPNGAVPPAAHLLTTRRQFEDFRAALLAFELE